MPSVLVPGLNCSARLYSDQIPALWRFGPVIVADHTRDDSIAAIARRTLATAPPRFALVGLSMGGYVAFEIMRQAPERVARLALLDTAPGAEVPAQTQARLPFIEMAATGRFAEVPDGQFPRLVHTDRHGDAALKALVRIMAEETGAEAFLRQMTAIMARFDSAPGTGRDRVPDPRAGRRGRRAHAARSIAGHGGRHSRRPPRGGSRQRTSLDARTPAGGQCGAGGMDDAIARHPPSQTAQVRPRVLKRPAPPRRRIPRVPE